MDMGFSFTRSAVDLGDQYLAQGQFTFTSDQTNNQIAGFVNLGLRYEDRREEKCRQSAVKNRSTGWKGSEQMREVTESS
jgi:hypothetical protein